MVDLIPRYKKSGYWRNSEDQRIHILLAEQALGRSLPDGAEVHHLDGERGNNEKGNLVICQNRSYHKLLHSRKDVLDRGSNPNTHKWCCYHQKDEPRSVFNKSKKGMMKLQSACKEGMKMYKEKGRRYG